MIFDIGASEMVDHTSSKPDRHHNERTLDTPEEHDREHHLEDDQKEHGGEKIERSTPHHEHGNNHANIVGEALVEALQRRFPESTCTHHQVIPARPARNCPWPEWVHPSLVALLRHPTDGFGLDRPYEHQARTAELAHNGHHVVVATGTSSGKSLGYLLPVLDALGRDQRACALYLTPTKALGSDQWAKIAKLCRGWDALGNVHPSAYDGDTPQDARGAIRDQARLVVSNPDMLHSGILPNHQRWSRVLRHLRYIVVDECHTYRGVFGASVALVLRRLMRIARRYGSHPTVIFASATSGNPAEHAETLLATPVEAVTSDAAPTGARSVVLWEPGFLPSATGEHGAPVRRPAGTEAAGLMAALVTEGARTLTFVRSRRGAEVVALRTAEELAGNHRRDLAERIAAYRAGYLPEARRALERQLDEGELVGVATTNALELGIDIGGLDAVVTAGFPGTIASFWQQAGRAGRRGQGSLAVFVARDEPLDTYLVHHPEALLGKPIEAAVLNPSNPHILGGHLLCAAEEHPLSDAEIEQLHARDVAAQLASQGLLRRRPRGWYSTPRPGEAPIHQTVHLRGTGSTVTIVDGTDGQVLGMADAASAMSQVHPGAVYLHQGSTYVVDELLLDDHLALVHAADPDYHTQSQSVTDIQIVGEPDHLQNPAPGLWVANVEVEVTNQVTGYAQKGFDGETIQMVPLDLPPQVLTTRAVAYTVDPAVLDALGIADVPGSLHAAEHAAIGMLPLLATCDRWDIGGVSTAEHPDTGLPTVFVYDGYPGGAGFADYGYEHFTQWIQVTFDAVRSCSCEAGCPSCVQSPKCGNGNSPLDKHGAIALLGAMCTMLGAA